MTSGDHPQWENSQPSSFLVENSGLLPPGRALDVAMGGGRNAVYLAGLGWEVEGVDISAQAVESALRLAREKALTIDARVGDLEGDYTIAPGAYDLIICFNYLQRSLIPALKGGLKYGGMIVFETFTIDQPRFSLPHNPDFLLGYNELLEMFRDFRCLRYREGIFDNRRAIASLVAEKTTQTSKLKSQN
jgi:tellurite methyltransferase